MGKSVRVFYHKPFWIIFMVGLVTAFALGFYLQKYQNLFLTPIQIDIVRFAILTGFFIAGIAAGICFLREGTRRTSRLAGQWVAEGNKYEDVQYKMLLNVISDIIFELDETGMPVFINDRFTVLTGIPLEDVMGNNFFDIFPPEQREKNIERYEKFIAGTLKPYRVKTYIQSYDGPPRQIEVAFRMLSQDEDGKMHAIGTISDRQGAAVAKKAVLDAEQKYKEMFDHSVSGIYQSTPEGKFISVNPALALILGYENVGDVIRSVHSIASQIYVRPEERAIFKNQIDHHGQVAGFETQMYKKDGTKIWVVENARAVMGDDGHLKYYEGSLWDITERRESESALKEAKLMAEITSRTKTEFLANMSHELRTPLNAIIGFSEILKDEIMGPMGNPSYKDYAADIYNSGHGLLKIISEILEVSKIETGNRQLNESPVKLSRAVGACLVILKGKIEDNHLTVEVDIPEAFPELIGEELVIKQILLNLIGNAVKFTPNNGKITIRGKIEDRSGRMLLEVADTGIGMSAEALERCMQPFWQANASLARDTSGTGLGLTLVQSLAKMHQAVLTLESVEGKGTTARITFPKERILISKPREAAPAAQTGSSN